MKISRRIKLGCITPFLAVILIIIVMDLISRSAYRRDLPDSASNIKEYSSGIVDFIRLVKADLPWEDYETYAKTLQFKEQFNSAKHLEERSKIGMGVSDAPAWWDPPRPSDITYFDYVKGEESLRVLNYANGSVYYMYILW